jgi:hypothetical protein
MNKTMIIWAGILVIAMAAAIFFISNKATGFDGIDNFEGEVTFYKSPTCGCCTIHSNYLSTQGKMRVKNNEISDQMLSGIKNQKGIPGALQSCHTAIIGDYFVEGHIPLEAINKLLEERPDVAGIAMPGMPSGSPGMPGRKTGDFVVFSVNHDGSWQEFMRI